MKKSIISNPDIVTDFYYYHGNTVGVVVKDNGIEELEDVISFDTNGEAQEYFENLN